MLPPEWELRWAEIRQEIRHFDYAAAGRKARARFTQFGEFMAGAPTRAADPLWPASWLRPKGNLSRAQLSLLLAIAFLPLLMMLVRISAWPGAVGPEMTVSWIASIGNDLNQVLSLGRIPAGDRDRVLYMLFLPTGAMLIALARLTFGVRVIGFRAILISVGFQESGIVPSLILILVMVGIVIAVRPALVAIRLPYYARVSVIMSLACVVLLAAVLLAPAIRSEVLWGVAFFPVIVLGLLAEGIAKTLDRDSGLTAMWRTGMTIGIALLLAGVSQIPILREIALEFPELVISQIVAIILISEYLDLRLFQDLDAKLSGIAIPRLFSNDDAFRVAVVRNHRTGGVVGRIGVPSRGGYRRRRVRQIVQALRENGHTVKVIEGDMSLLSKLRDFIPMHPTSEQPGGIVLNLSHGIQGEVSQAHVPGMHEMAGLAFSGPTSHGLSLAQDRVASTSLLRNANIPTPDCSVVDEVRPEHAELQFPVVVKPRSATTYKLRIANNVSELEEAVRVVRRRERQQVVCEGLVQGREIDVAIVGNDPPQCLPLVELLPGDKEKVCPAALDEAVSARVRKAALDAFIACQGRDYAVVNLRVTDTGEPVVLEVSTHPVFEEEGSFELAAEAAGWSVGEWLGRIVDVARERYQSRSMLPALEVVATADVDGTAKGGLLVAE